MNWTSLFGKAIVNSRLAQYPDAKIYNAATMLAPEERPKVPVRMVNNDWAKSRPTPMWFDSAKPDHISVSTGSPSYKKGDMPRLAAMLGHEAIHSGGQMAEVPGYERETAILQRFGLGSSQRIKDIEEIKKRFK